MTCTPNGRRTSLCIEHLLTESERRRFWRWVDKRSDPRGCWVWFGHRRADRFGYGQWNYRRVGERHTLMAHRIAYALTHGPIPQGAFICHRCDTPVCVNPAHLFVGTNQDNMDDMYTKGRGRKARGERHPLGKITPSVAAQIKERLAAGVGGPDICREFPVSRAVLSVVRRGKHWTERDT
jgi:hypothetical protein